MVVAAVTEVMMVVERVVVVGGVELSRLVFSESFCFFLPFKTLDLFL